MHRSKLHLEFLSFTGMKQVAERHMQHYQLTAIIKTLLDMLFKALLWKSFFFLSFGKHMYPGSSQSEKYSVEVMEVTLKLTDNSNFASRPLTPNFTLDKEFTLFKGEICTFHTLSLSTEVTASWNDSRVYRKHDKCTVRSLLEDSRLFQIWKMYPVANFYVCLIAFDLYEN